ncbi:hypothetical protein OESDEN_12222 [Oesophagostomum dentatum]|uniref:FHOD1/3-like FH3 domain-containing protein n=1 Tax=Oesophagostomum dentatum TaxID=61180 RepID=A0A0B1SRN7_OESDE|nr:hypothetical protein OESDEN_12222 [Oesophagostomum dentatum]
MACSESYARYPLRDKAVYSAAPVKASLARTVPTYDELYSSSAPSTQKPILKAYDIDLSIRIDASSSATPPRIGRVTCTFDEIDAYKPRSSSSSSMKLDLPLIVKPLRQFDARGGSRDSTLDRRSRSSETREQQPYLAEVRPQRLEAPAICRRRTMGGADDAKPKWYSSSVDGAAESSTLPRNFLRKPSVLHTAAPVQFRLVVKTALKLLLVFIEYNDNNALLVLAAISAVDRAKGQQDWSALMKVISEKDSPDPETLVYGMTVINKTLRGIPD